MYNAYPEMRDSEYHNWPFRFTLRREHVSDEFVLLSLLEDRVENSWVGDLRLPDLGDQRFRLLEAMQERNFRMQSVGQPELRHHCQKCMEIIPNDEGKPARRSCAFIIRVYILNDTICREDTCGGYGWGNHRAPLLR